jgi:uncharacterized delta-60 repeat protein
MIKTAGLRRLLRPAAKVAMMIMIAALTGANVAWAQAAGTLDPTFGTDGTVTTTFTGDTSPVMMPVGAIEQSNGDIVVLSQFDFVSDSGTQIGLTRYTSAGELDTTFGTKGSTITAFSTFTFDPFAFALESNGEFLVAGTVGGTASGALEFGLARFTASGVLDATFGTSGVAAVQIGTRPDAPSAFMLQPNGQILMGGFEDGGGKKQPGSLSVARFNSNGELDTMFGTGGFVLVTPKVLGPEAFALLSNGDYLAVGENTSGTGGTVVEFSSTGELRSTVTTGTVTASSPLQGLEDSPTVFEPNGSYVVANQTATSHDETTHPVVSLFSEAGVESTAFAATKIAFGGFGKNTGQAIAVQSNGQVIVGGFVANASPIFGGLARLDTNGDLDTTFGSGGTLAIDNGVNALLIDNNGNIDAIEATGNDGIVVARYLAN